MLADHARTVIIIERDEVNVAGRPRSGVPQDRQGHGGVESARLRDGKLVEHHMYWDTLGIMRQLGLLST